VRAHRRRVNGAGDGARDDDGSRAGRSGCHGHQSTARLRAQGSGGSWLRVSRRGARPSRRRTAGRAEARARWPVGQRAWRGFSRALESLRSGRTWDPGRAPGPPTMAVRCVRPVTRLPSEAATCASANRRPGQLNQDRSDETGQIGWPRPHAGSGPSLGRFAARRARDGRAHRDDPLIRSGRIWSALSLWYGSRATPCDRFRGGPNSIGPVRSRHVLEASAWPLWPAATPGTIRKCRNSRAGLQPGQPGAMASDQCGNSGHGLKARPHISGVYPF
jgi:hypothetical protein